jgi:hypothetical protein
MLAWRIFHPTRLGPPVAGEGGTACTSQLVPAHALQIWPRTVAAGAAAGAHGACILCRFLCFVKLPRRLRGSAGITAICAAAAN